MAFLLMSASHKIYFLYLLIAFTCLSCMSFPDSQADETTPPTFTNPIIVSGQDPWVIQRDKSYFYCYSRKGQIWVSRANNLLSIGKAEPVCVWTPENTRPYSKELWAPELHYLEGRWYIYLAADDGDNFHHRMIVLEGKEKDPQQPFTFKAKIAAPTDRWAIDGTILKMADQRLFFIWSGWEGEKNISQNLYIAPMKNPWTISGERVCISEPTYPWEKNGKPLINEGPEVLQHNSKTFIIYSASGSWGDDYCLGQLELTGNDPMQKSAWIKKPTPVFSRTDKVFGPGHASFVKSLDGKEDWIVYHTAKFSGAGWNRNVRIQPFIWNEDGSPNFGTPVAEGTQLHTP